MYLFSYYFVCAYHYTHSNTCLHIFFKGSSTAFKLHCCRTASCVFFFPLSFFLSFQKALKHLEFIGECLHNMGNTVWHRKIYTDRWVDIFKVGRTTLDDEE